MKIKLRKFGEIIKIKLNKLPVKISLLYFIISFFWILLSDNFTQVLFANSRIRLIASTLKGWVYVIIITAFLYYILNRALKKLDAAENRLKQKYEELKTSEDRLKRAQTIAHVGNWEFDIISQRMWASEEASLIYGIEPSAPFLPLNVVQKIVASEDKPMMDLAFHKLITGESDYNVEFRITRYNDGQERVLHSIAKLERDDAGVPVKVLGVVMDITEEKQAELNIKQSHEELASLYEELAASDEELKQQYDEIHKLAYNDLVTGLPNRLFLQEKLMEIINTSKTKVILMFIDLDNFKNINDSFGHFSGDAVLTEIGKKLTDTVDAETFVARLGGDEFAVVISDTEFSGEVNEIARKLLINMVTSFSEKGVTIHMSASIGIAIFPDHADSFEELLKSADTAMYEAKKQGKNQYVIFDPSMNNRLYAKIAMEGYLRTAVDNNELELYYQPFFNLKSHRIYGFEALIRWNSPVYGMVLPSVFIPIAEETGLISQIGKWVLQTACKFISGLNNSRDDKLLVSVNISVHQLAQDNLVDDVIHILKENALDPELLALEITESTLMEDVETKLRKINTLKEYGIKVALDDFGTGYSSLTYLKKLPISILKLDKAFIDDITSSKTDKDIVKSIILLANTLDLTVIAEGIEEKEQLDCIADLGCDMIQGYYISRPLPGDKVISFLQ